MQGRLRLATPQARDGKGRLGAKAWANPIIRLGGMFRSSGACLLVRARVGIRAGTHLIHIVQGLGPAPTSFTLYSTSPRSSFGNHQG